jgi:hypothetical protein
MSTPQLTVHFLLVDSLFITPNQGRGAKYCFTQAFRYSSSASVGWIPMQRVAVLKVWAYFLIDADRLISQDSGTCHPSASCMHFLCSQQQPRSQQLWGCQGCTWQVLVIPLCISLSIGEFGGIHTYSQKNKSKGVYTYVGYIFIYIDLVASFVTWQTLYRWIWLSLFYSFQVLSLVRKSPRSVYYTCTSKRGSFGQLSCSVYSQLEVKKKLSELGACGSSL